MNNSKNFNKLTASIFMGTFLLSSNVYGDDILSETRFITGLSLGYSTFECP